MIKLDTGEYTFYFDTLDEKKQFIALDGLLKIELMDRKEKKKGTNNK